MAVKPPYPVQSDKFGYDGTGILIGGKWYDIYGGSAYPPNWKNVGTNMAEYLDTESPGKYGDAVQWLNHANYRTKNNFLTLWLTYGNSLDPGHGGKQFPVPGIPNPLKPKNPLAGVPNPISGVTDFLQRLWGVISSKEFWLRVAEVGIGAIMLGVGISHLSTNAGAALRKVPVYGKVIG